MRRNLVTFILILFTFVGAFLWWQFSENKFRLDVTHQYILWRSSSAHHVFVDEITSSSPVGTRFLARLDSGNRIMVKTSYTRALLLGQKVVLQGKFQPTVEDESNESFFQYLKLRNIVGTLDNVRILFCTEQDRSWLQNFLWLRNVFTAQVNNIFSQDVAGFLNGILLGDDDFLSKKTKEHFRIAGLTHVMAISGANMTMIAEMIFLALAFLPLKRKIIATVVILTIFTLVVGASAAILRAYVMAIIALIALHFGLPYLALRALFFVVIIMFFINPFIPLYDIGFQLSVMATLGLLLLNPLLNRVFSFLPYKWLREIMTITLSASIFTLPISLHYFGSWFPLSLIVNFLLVPIISSLSIMSYLALFFIVIPVFGEIVRLLLEIFFRLLLFVVDIAAIFSSLFVINFQFSWFFVLLYYLLLMLIIWFLQRRFSGKSSRTD